MMNYQFKNTHTVLSELLGFLQKMGDAVDFYFDHVKEGEILNPFLAEGKIVDCIGNNEALPPEFFNGFGIQTLILDTMHGRLSLSEKNFTDIIDKNAAAFTWHELTGDIIIEDLKMLFGNSQIVEFANWSDVRNASDIWDNLRRDVIKPLKKNDFDFIFYLGDTTKRLDFEVDEFLDIISDYALHGSVTLVLDEQKAAGLWVTLYGRKSYSEFSTLPGLIEKSRSIFDLINIDHLIIDSIPATLLFSRQHQFEIAARKSPCASKSAGTYFDAGYILGLLLKIEISHSLALGRAVSGLWAESGFKPNRKMLLAYIEKWIVEIESFTPEENQLSVA